MDIPAPSHDAPVVDRIDVTCCRIPTDHAESDGTHEWGATTIVVVEAKAADIVGVGYSYGGASAALIVRDILTTVVCSRNIFDTGATWLDMLAAVRNAGRPGIASCAVSAVDMALWDLRARVLGIALCDLLGNSRASIAAYGSGGFTSYSVPALQEQLAGWVDEGFTMVKMKVGRDPESDARRVGAARAAIGDSIGLFVDANGAYHRKQALELSYIFAELGVSWFEEPVSSDDLEGLRLVRDHGPPGMVIAAGEYGYDAMYFRRMIESGAVDVLQVDATRCLGVTGFLQAAALCFSANLPLSGHSSPSVHAHLCCSSPKALHVELYHDHFRLERLLFDGTIAPRRGHLWPDRSRPGLGLELKRADAERYAM